MKSTPSVILTTVLLAALSAPVVLTAFTDPPPLAPPQAPQAPTTMHAEARVVQVDVIVRDSRGKPVEDLKKEDFTITDNGKPRPFTIFSFNKLNDSNPPKPILTSGQTTSAIAHLPPLPPNTFTNTRPSPPPEGHSTIILLDTINGWFDTYNNARQGVLGLVDKVPADEKIAIYVIQNGDGLALLQDYTTDRARLTEVMTNFVPRGMHPAPPGDSLDGQGMADVPGPREGPKPTRPSTAGAPPPPDATNPSPREVVASLQQGSEAVRLSLQAIAEKLRELPGRKSVYWITEGFPPRLLRDMNRIAWDKTVNALNDANVAVNSVDSFMLGGPPTRFRGPGGIVTMKQVADETGGQSYFHRNDLDVAMASGIADSRTSYTLGFYLTEMDGKYHALKVHVDRPGLDLNYRQGYDAKSDAIQALSARKSDLEAALFNPQGSAAVGITARLEVTPGNPRGTLTAHVKMDPESLSLKQVADGFDGKVDEMFIEQNAAGLEVGRVSVTKAFEVASAQKMNFDNQGAMLSQAIPLAPGAVKLSIIVRDSASGRTGSLTIPLETVAGSATQSKEK